MQLVFLFGISISTPSPFFHFINTRPCVLCGCQTLPYSDPFPEDQSSPVYSGSYTGSPPERYRSEFQFSLGAPSASLYKSSELPIVYLNKGQFYPITLQGVDSSACLTATKVKVRHHQQQKDLMEYSFGFRNNSCFVYPACGSVFLMVT